VRSVILLLTYSLTSIVRQPSRPLIAIREIHRMTVDRATGWPDPGAFRATPVAFGRDVVGIASSTGASIAIPRDIDADHAVMTDDPGGIVGGSGRIIDSSAGIGAESFGIASNLVEVTSDPVGIVGYPVGFVANPDGVTT
jgi:hypothetical protein